MPADGVTAHLLVVRHGEINDDVRAAEIPHTQLRCNRLPLQRVFRCEDCRFTRDKIAIPVVAVQLAIVDREAEQDVFAASSVDGRDRSVCCVCRKCPRPCGQERGSTGALHEVSAAFSSAVCHGGPFCGSTVCWSRLCGGWLYARNVKPSKLANPTVRQKAVSLKTLGEYLDLSPATISLVLNHSPVAASIPLATRQRVIEAAKKFDYRPNFSARSLRTSRSFTVGIIAPEHSEGYFTNVMMGVETCLIQAGYLYLTVSHLGRRDLLQEYPRLLMNRNVDGLILINTVLEEEIGLPTVAISGHSKFESVSNIILDHERAAIFTLKHLYDLGHRRIAMMKGQPDALDSEPRWQAMMNAARELGIKVNPELNVFLKTNSWSPELGYPVVSDLLRRTRDFTALVCFNDLAAIGAVRAIVDCNLRCPEDISVVGFDDISAAGYSIPRLTTVRQPLQQMGETAARILVERIQNPENAGQHENYFLPELIIRESTTRSPARRRQQASR